MAKNKNIKKINKLWDEFLKNGGDRMTPRNMVFIHFIIFLVLYIVLSYFYDNFVIFVIFVILSVVKTTTRFQKVYYSKNAFNFSN